MRLYVLIERLTLLRGVAMSILYANGCDQIFTNIRLLRSDIITRNTQRIRYIQE